VATLLGLPDARVVAANIAYFSTVTIKPARHEWAVPYTNLRRLTGGEQVEDRINYFERMLADNPDNPTGLLALANEYGKGELYEDEAAVLQRYVSLPNNDDEGNAYARLGDVLSRLGRKDEARAIYEKGVQQAEKHGHSGMAEDLRVAIIQLGEQD
jgi:tetratricopeptide (TPR) repeat protein